MVYFTTGRIKWENICKLGTFTWKVLLSLSLVGHTFLIEKGPNMQILRKIFHFAHRHVFNHRDKLLCNELLFEPHRLSLNIKWTHFMACPHFIPMSIFLRVLFMNILLLISKWAHFPQPNDQWTNLFLNATRFGSAWGGERNEICI